MNDLIDTATTMTATATVTAPVAHGLGRVADDWEAAEVWLWAIASRGRRNSPETVATYRYHIAKLRWFCEHVHGVPPSRWTAQDVEAVYGFMADLPDWALCARDEMTGGYAGVDDEGYSPFRKQPSASRRSEIQRCIHAMFRVWREMGYIAINPMGLHGAGTTRKINVNRAVNADLYDIVLDTMEATEKVTFASRQAYTRDRFIFNALRELGLRASELIKATMGAFTVSLLKTEAAKSRKQRRTLKRSMRT